MKAESTAKTPDTTQPLVKKAVPKENAEKRAAVERQQWDKARKALYEYWQDQK